ncbi:hypothetical protein N6G95_09665 [Pediococcus inopinatus]|uniref:hypothetical protein n=1 Tax=Pediococcus inopinatus TaxID=114090 RepID=UPI002B25D879|nr:hypothetical protein [Pediococcus inopinatus]WPC19470.1 hypothetical protein N6G95_09665 [Pediococcus inopinatus]
MSDYMNQRQYKAVMDDANLYESMTVKLYLKRAAHFKQAKKVVDEQLTRHTTNKVLKKYAKELDDERVKSVWLAIMTAKDEKEQGWLFQEDGEDFVEQQITKYKGDLSQQTKIEKESMDLVELFEEMVRRQAKGDFR